jgi:hypothetical protein
MKFSDQIVGLFHHFEFEMQLLSAEDIAQIMFPKLSQKPKAVVLLVKINQNFDPQPPP